jgi:hypothetical protein
MEHRESPRIGRVDDRAGDAVTGPAPSRRFARLVASPAVRRLAVNRVGLAVVASIAILGLVVAAGTLARRSASEFLQRQPEYQLAFKEIALEPPPPAWYRGGTEGFLKRVREEAREEESFSVLGVDLARLDRAFRLYAWVEKVEQVTRSYPNRVVVRLAYREPVAVAHSGDQAAVVVDRDGVILPRGEIEWEAAGPLILIAGLPPPVDPRPGRFWKSGDAAKGTVQADERVLAAARLAAFLKSKQARPESSIPALRFMALHPEVKRQIFVECASMMMILWGDAPGEEPPGQLTAEARWTMLRDWVKENPARVVEHPSYLHFTKTGVSIQHVARTASSRR